MQLLKLHADGDMRDRDNLGFQGPVLTKIDYQAILSQALEEGQGISRLSSNFQGVLIL
jgi:hypothetical protein